MLKRPTDWLTKLPRKPYFGIIVAYGILLFFCLLVIFTDDITTLVTWAEPQNVNISVDVPKRVGADVPFTIAVAVENTDDKAQRLEAINFTTEYLEGIEVDDVGNFGVDFLAARGIDRHSNAYLDFTLAIIGRRSYVYKDRIEPGSRLDVQLVGIGLDGGVFSGKLEVCINSNSVCAIYDIETVVDE